MSINQQLLKEISIQYEYVNNKEYTFSTTIQDKEYEVSCTVNDGVALFIEVTQDDEFVLMPEVDELLIELVFKGYIEDENK
ncbi:unnamed protein product [marine sediment metagenome]|uniref:Uncharacterized protein n=1 Tax=marine sediment metagenome TaxID=412755 RepID=X1B449_9ZZZZ